MTDKSLDPSTPSPAAEELCPIWDMIDAILDGAAKVKEGGETYLPKFPAESHDEYERRKKSAPWRPEFTDILRGIVSMPFAKDVALAGTPSEDMKALADDIDGRGNNLHVFAKSFFEAGAAYGAAGILIDFPPMPAGATRADEIAAHARPYWVMVKANEIIALRTKRVGARDVVTHLRLKECSTVINGFEETEVEKIRVLEPGLWQLWHEVKNATGETVWQIEDEGTLTMDEVPFVFFATAEREGPQYVRPPLLDLAVMQIELYRFMSGEEQIYTMAGSPMLTANGMGAPENGTVEVGPGRILYAPGVEHIQTSWAYIQPNADNLRAISEKAGKIIDDMRRLGLQPTLPKTGNVTATASGIDAAKGHTAVGTWANALKDALEQAFVFTTKWLKSTEDVEVNVSTDFSVGMYGAEEVKALIDMRDKGMISEETLFDELLRRGVLGPQFDKAEEEARLIGEVPTVQDMLNAIPPPVDPTTGLPIVADPNAGA